MKTPSKMDQAREIIWDRIEEAAETLKRMPDRERALLRKSERGQEWPAMLHQAFEHAAHEGLKVKMPPPSAARITRMEEVLDWLLELAKQEPGYVKVVWLRCAMRRKTSEIARIVGVTRWTVNAHLKAGLTLIAVDIAPRIRDAA